MKKGLAVGVFALVAVTMFVGCGDEETNDILNGVDNHISSSFNVTYGNNEEMTLTWTKNTSHESELLLTGFNAGEDPILEAEYGSPHFHYSIDKVSAIGTYIINCEPAIRSGDWTKYSCLREGMFKNQQDTSIDNSFVIPTSGNPSRVYDMKINNSTDTIGEISHH